MAGTVTMNKIYDELKQIEKKIVTKEEMEKILETVEIISNQNTMEQIRQSEEDIQAGRIKKITSVRDI